MNKPLFSIITTCKNSANTVRQTIESVLSQRGDFEIEYIFTDALSTDGTREIIAEYGDKIKLIDAPKLNQSEGINLGFQMAKGDYIAFINADDVYQAGAFDLADRAFRCNPDKLWLVGQCDIIDEKGFPMHGFISRYKNFLLKNYSYFLLLTENFICQPAVFLRRSALETCGYLDTSENLAMDYEWWLRIGRDNSPIIINEKLASFRRMRNTKSNRFFVQQFKDDLRLSLKYSKLAGAAARMAIPFKYFNYLKTISAYSLIYKPSKS
ncbi:MAG TPA: glycosyltransferase [Oligoflexia bacterium]|nr:glycosyltransferase [Oligoflexia bacterium]HMP27438.1 glycosyltransferase [Oligoflexia bacterium]